VCKTRYPSFRYKIQKRFLHLNGFPGTGKLVVARAITNLLGAENVEILDGHRLIDPVAARFPRSHPEYHAKRKKERDRVFKDYVSTPGHKNRVMLFTGLVRIYTDVQPGSRITDPTDFSIAQASLDAAVRAECLFFSVVLHCELDENLWRAVNEERRNGNYEVDKTG
jgi:hypothetical protein